MERFPGENRHPCLFVFRLECVLFFTKIKLPCQEGLAGSVFAFVRYVVGSRPGGIMSNTTASLQT